jgi:hypothetical protein
MAISLVGILGVLEVQSVALRGQERQIVAKHTANYSESNEHCDKMEEEPPVLAMRCGWEITLNSLLRSYDHTEAKAIIGDGHAPPYSGVWEQYQIIKKIHDDMETALYSHIVDFNSYEWLKMKILGFYVLLVGVAIKVAKTTAEVFRWHNGI